MKILNSSKITLNHSSPLELNALRLVPVDVRSDDFPVSLVAFRKSD